MPMRSRTPSEADSDPAVVPPAAAAGETGQAAAAGGAPPPDILVVDDNPDNLVAIEVALGDLGRRLVKAASGRSALRHLLERDFALILLDVQMPGMDGFETARLVRSRRRSRHIPIVFITAYSRDDDDVQRAYALGAVDFLFKPIVPEVLRAKAQVFVELQQRTAEVKAQGDRLRELERRELERKLATERQRWEAEALREENRRKDEFLALLAHELRNPLAPMVTGLELVRRYDIEHSGLQRVWESMGRQVKHLVRLVDDLLDLSRISQGKIALQREVVDLATAARQALESVEPFVQKKGHDLQATFPEEPMPVTGDPVRLVQILSNLLHNAVRYTEPGGHLRLTLSRDDNDAVARVADDGRGISPEMLESIFEMFVQESEGSGLGLGLTIVHRLVDLHGGRVRAYSRGRGKGSEFVVFLPLAAEPSDPDAADAATSEEAAAEEPEGPALRVAVVEDESDIREATADLLAAWGHQVETAADGNEGLRLILDSRPDVALVDIALPGLDGLSLARKIKNTLGQRSPRLVAISGFGRKQDRDQAAACGFDDYLVKPATPTDLSRALRSNQDDDGENDAAEEE
jgi:signal transduction histidine kinase